MAKFTIIGTGAWGTALANVLLDNNNFVQMYGIDDKELQDLKNQKNTKYFGNSKLSQVPLVTNKIDDIINFAPNYLILAVPSVYIQSSLESIIYKLKNKPIVINVAKGFNPNTNDLWSKTLKKIIKKRASGYATLIGPSFAVEVFNRNYTVVNVISTSKKISTKVAKSFTNKYFKCVTIKDEVGAEIIGTMKNIMAIALGIAYEQHISINTRAAMLAQAVKEISIVINLYGGSINSLYNFCGIGDIFLTCTDEKSRNFSFGKSIAKNGLKKTLENMKSKTVEGYVATKIAYKMLKNNLKSTPLVSELYKVLYKNSKVNDFVEKIIKKII